MTHCSLLPRLALPLALGISLGGCLGTGERHGSTPGRRPAMPTMALRDASSVNRVSESDIIEAGVRVARSDPEGVVRELRSVGDPAQRAILAERIVDELARRDPRLSARVALALGTAFGNMSIVEGAARRLARQDPEFALGWMLELPAGSSSRSMSRTFIDEYVRDDPRAAIERIRGLPAGAARDDLLVLAAAAWARRDGEAAISWLRELPDDELRRRLTSSVGFEVAQKHPDRALEVAEMLPEGRDRWLLLSAIGQTWVAVDSKAALAWAGQLPAGEPRDAAFAGIDTGFGMPVSRRLRGAPGTRGGSSRTRGGTAAAAAWPDVTSPAFAAWLATQPPGMSREEAILEYIRQRGALEPDAVAPLLSAMAPGTLRDQAMETYVDGLLIGRSPMEAARWVRSLPRSERSDELIEKTARRWLLTNPDAAVDWIEQSTLPAYRKEQLLREAGR